MTVSGELEAASRDKRGRKREKKNNNPGPAPPRETKLIGHLQ